MSHHKASRPKGSLSRRSRPRKRLRRCRPVRTDRSDAGRCSGLRTDPHIQFLPLRIRRDTIPVSKLHPSCNAHRKQNKPEDLTSRRRICPPHIQYRSVRSIPQRKRQNCTLGPFHSRDCIPRNVERRPRSQRTQCRTGSPIGRRSRPRIVLRRRLDPRRS